MCENFFERCKEERIVCGTLPYANSRGLYLLITKVEYEQLHKEIADLRKTVEILMARVKEVEGMLHKDSHNSHKPPGSNEFKKMKNNRIKGEHSRGGQPGNEGTTLKVVKHPDKRVRCKAKGKCSCGTSLENLPVTRTEKRNLTCLLN